MPAPRSLLKGFERVIATAEAHPAKRQLISDTETRGLFLRVMPSGHKSFTVLARAPSGKQVWASLGECDGIALETARQKAREVVRRIKSGLPPFALAAPAKVAETFAEVHDSFITRHVDKQALRSASEIKRIFRVYALPSWGPRPIQDIKRSDVSDLLDRVEDNNGPVMADRVLAAVSKMLNWYMARNDDYASPIIRGMGRSKASDRARKRILSDEELRLVWRVAAASGTFGGIVKFAILTAQRRTKILELQWDQVSNDIWTIPVQPREKTTAGVLPLPPLALEILHDRDRLSGNPHVFGGRGCKPIGGYSKLKLRFDAAAASSNGSVPLPPWTLHDLRRTAKSLMARAGVAREVSERVLGHVIPGVEGVYDRHDYVAEKRDALIKLSELVETIVSSGRQASSLEVEP